jgi:lactate 2-monooxygenase
VTDQPFANYQYEIYLAGLGDQRPELPIDFEALQRRAEAELTPEAFGYVAGSAGAERTAHANRQAFDRWRIVPRMLGDVEERDLSVTVLGHDLAAPVMIGPVGVLSIVHPEAEKAVARAASSLGVPFTVSTVSSYTMEEVAEAAGEGRRWFQLYWPKDRDLAASFVARAERAGYSAIVVTLDTRLLAWRPRDLNAAYLPFLHGTGLANYFTDPVFLDGLEKSPEEDLGAAVLKWAGLFADPTTTWDDVAFLREQTDLPIILKGIQHPDDAREAVARGCEGIVVSNHGGRQVDGAVGSLEMLPDIVAAVGSDTTVLFDSGVRTGADVFKAVALGARSVLIGRPYAYALGLGGEDGVRQLLRGLLADLDLTMALAGQRSLSDLGPHLLAQ